MKYLRIHKLIKDEETIWHICEVLDIDFNMPEKLADDSSPNQWKKIEVTDTFREDNPEPEMFFINGEDENGGMKWKHTDNKWYEIKRECHHRQLYNIDTGEVSCYLAIYPENLKTEIP